MSPILPVIDLQRGVVVRGVAGQREKYQPIQSMLVNEPSPGAIAKAFYDVLGCRDVYIADLDAIAGDTPAWADYEAIAEAGLNLWIDAGAGNYASAQAIAARQFAGEPVQRIIVGLESLESREQLARIAAEVEPKRLVFSLDLKNGQPLAKCPHWQAQSALDIISDVIRLGIEALIVLDLARVGVGQGTGTEQLCQQLKAQWPEVELIGGGGVNSQSDVDRLVAAGMSRVLVASALHDGRIDSSSFSN